MRRIGVLLPALLLAAAGADEGDGTPLPPDPSALPPAEAIAALGPGQWYEIPDSKLDAVKANPPPKGNFENIIAAWSGGAYDTKRDRLIVWGGGHTDYRGNEVYAFSLGTFRWERLTEPSAGPPKEPDRDTHEDGRPVARHTYDYIEYIPPPVDRLFCGGGGALSYDSFSDPNTYLFDFERREWETKSKDPMYGTGALCAVGPDGIVWQQGTGDTRRSLASYDALRDTWTTHVEYRGWLGPKMTAAIDPVQKKFVAIGNGEARVWDLERPYLVPAALDAAGDAAIVQTHSPGIDFEPVRGTLVAWNGGAKVYALDLAAMTWTSRETVGAPEAARYGTYGRWRYVPSRNVFVVVNATRGNVFVYRHAAR
jgi:hypothetical protein